MLNLPKMAQEATCVKLGVARQCYNYAPGSRIVYLSRNTLAEFEILRLHLL